MKKRYLITLLLIFLCAFQIQFLQAQNECFTLQLSSETGQVGDTVAVDVTVKGFDEIIGMQYSMNWDADNLEFIEISNFNLPFLSTSNFGIIPPQSTNKLTFLWIDYNLEGVSVVDETIIYRIYFKILAPGINPIHFKNTPTPEEFTTSAEAKIKNFALIDGQIGSTSQDVLEIEEACINSDECISSTAILVAPEITGGHPPYNFEWTGPEGFSSDTRELTGVATNGYYYFKVTDSQENIMEAWYSIDLRGGYELQTSVSPDACSDDNTGQIQVNMVSEGNFNYSWNTGDTTMSITELAAGNYVLTIEDVDNGCFYLENFVLPENIRYQVDAGRIPATCEVTSDGKILLYIHDSFAPPSTYTYQWSNGATTKNIQDIPSGHYTVTVTNNVECVVEKSIWLGTHSWLDTISISVGDACPGPDNGLINVHSDTSAAYDYLWSTGDTTEDLNNLEEGNYRLTITDQIGCTSIRDIHVGTEQLLTSLDHRCNSLNSIQVDATVISSGTAPYTFIWNTGDSLVEQQTASVILPNEGTYSLTITDALNECSTVFEDLNIECFPPGSLYLNFENSKDTLEVGEQLCVQAIVDRFVNIEVFDFRLLWDPSRLLFESVTGSNDQLNYTHLVHYDYQEALGNGELFVSWFRADDDEVITLPNGSALLEFCFTVLGPTLGESEIIVSEAAYQLNFYQATGNQLNTVPGQSTFYVTPPSISLRAGQTNALQGQDICIPIQVDNFEDVSDMKFSINWDPTQLDFQGIEELNLPGLTPECFAQDIDGMLSLDWHAPDGISMPNDTSNIFSLCFTAIGNAPETYLEFSDTPLAMEAMNSDSLQMTINHQPGMVAITGVPVWPGNTDLSPVVNHYDLLNIGLAYGQSGPTRPEASLLWQEQPAAFWTYHTPNSAINAVHFDTDGNGTINQNDLEAITQNWHANTTAWQDTPELPVASSLTTPSIWIAPQTLNPGQTATLSIELGNQFAPAESIYGLAFTIVYDPAAVVGGSLSASFADSWLGDENNDLITVYRERAEDNRIDIALSRINQENQSGFGAIAQLNLTIAELIQEENYAMAFDIENVRIINAGEEVIPSVQPTTYSEILGTTDTHSPELANQVSIFPVPARDFLQIRTEALTVENSSLFTIDGKFIRQWSGNPQEISTGEFESGTYVLKLSTREGTVHKRFVKTR